MHYDPRLFTERPDRTKHRASVTGNSRVSPARLADGNPGVLIKYGNTFGVLSAADAIKFATLIADTVEHATEMPKRP